MRILIINDYTEAFGGAEVYTGQLRRLLEDDGHQVQLIGGGSETAASFVSRWFSLRWYRRTRAVLREFQPDLVHIHNCSRLVSPAPALAARRAGVPVVMTVHDAHLVCPKTWMIYQDGLPCRFGFGPRCISSSCKSDATGPFAWPYHLIKSLKVLIHRRLLRASVDLFICPSEWLGEWVRRSLSARKVTVIGHFAEAKATGGVRMKDAGTRSLLYVGRLAPAKGVDTAIKALSHLPDDVTLDIVGDGPEHARLAALARSLGVEGRIRFRGSLPREDIAQLYETAGALVVPSRWMEVGPLVIHEAAAHGLPVLGGARGGVAERIVPGETGLLFQVDDPIDLAQQATRLLESEMRQEMSSRIEVWSAERSSRRHLDGVLAAYRSVLTQTDPGRDQVLQEPRVA